MVRLILKCILFTAIWMLLCGGDLGSLVVGVPVIYVAMLLGGTGLQGAGLSISLVRLIGFVPFFLKASLRGGVDAAARAFGVTPRLSCGMIPFETSLSSGPAQVFFASVVGLLPGTLTTELRAGALLVHTLDDTKAVEEELQQLQERVAHIFGPNPTR